MNEQDTGPSAEDKDPLVVAVERLPESVEYHRKPGIIAFGFTSDALGGYLTVTRSRFDGDYGNVCRMTLQKDGRRDLAFCMTGDVLAAVANPEGHADRLAALFNESQRRGKENGTEES